MFTFEERLNEGISGTDAKANGETAADIMKVVKEEVLLVSCFTRRNLHLWENDVEKIFYPFYGEKEEIAKLVRDVGRLFFQLCKCVLKLILEFALDEVMPSLGDNLNRSLLLFGAHGFT